MNTEKYLYLSTENKEQLEEILNRYDGSEFLRFCVINEIFEEGLRSFLEKYKLYHFSLK